MVDDFRENRRRVRMSCRGAVEPASLQRKPTGRRSDVCSRKVEAYNLLERVPWAKRIEPQDGTVKWKSLVLQSLADCRMSGIGAPVDVGPDIGADT